MLDMILSQDIMLETVFFPLCVCLLSDVKHCTLLFY